MSKRRGWKISDLPHPEQRAAAASQLAGASFQDLPIETNLRPCSCGTDGVTPSGVCIACLGANKTPTVKRTRSRIMNRTETRYAARLEELKASGAIISYEFEAIRLNVGEAAWYTPDFFVVTVDSLAFHEVKGSWKAKNQRDARTRIKAAAKRFPHFKFVAAMKDRDADGGWNYEHFG